MASLTYPSLPDMKYLLFVFIMLASVAKSQPLRTIEGRVVDQRSGEPLPYASVTLRHHPEGTVCNLEGSFQLHLTNVAENDTLQISMIGYESYRVIIKAIRQNEYLNIRLKPTEHYLREVVVEDTITADEILRRALKRYKQNYGVSPYTTSGFYREVQRSDGKYVSLVESAVTAFYNGDNKQGKVRLDQLRRTKKFTHPSNAFWDKTNLFLNLFQQNFVVNGPKKVKKNTMKRLADVYIDEDKIYVLQWVNRIRPIPEKLYIRADDYAIIKLEEDYEIERDEEMIWPVPNAPLLRAKLQYKKLATIYERFEGRYYLKSIHINISLNYYNKITDERFQQFQINHHYVVTGINLHPDRSTFGSFDPMQMEQSLESIPFPYNPNFWNHYNMIQETPLDEQIKKDLEQDESLEKQFGKQ